MSSFAGGHPSWAGGSQAIRKMVIIVRIMMFEGKNWNMLIYANLALDHQKPSSKGHQRSTCFSHEPWPFAFKSPNSLGASRPLGMTYFGIASLIGMKGKLKLWTFCLETVALQYMVPGENSKTKFLDMNIGPPVHVHATWKKPTTWKWIDRKHEKWKSMTYDIFIFHPISCVSSYFSFPTKNYIT